MTVSSAVSAGSGRALRLLAFALLALGLGAAGGVVWWWVVDLPSYSVGPDGGASISERGLTEFFAGDAWFCVIGVVVGVTIGVVGWRLFAALGWPVAVGVVVLALLAALLCWWVGYELGPGPFVRRLAAADPGDVVPIELTVRAQAALLVWPFAAVIPVLLGSSLGRDDDEPRPLRIFGRRRTVSDGSAAAVGGGDRRPSGTGH